MIQLTTRRFAMAILILFGVSVVIFLLMNVLPGDPVAALLGPDASNADRLALRHSLGLDKALPLQYLDWIGRTLTGNLGYSPYRRAEVLDLLSQAWVNTAILAGFSAAFGLITGISLGFWAGVRRGKIADKVISTGGMAGLSIPSFFVAIILLTFFAARWRWLPAGGTAVSGGVGQGGAWEFIRHLIMPVIAGSLVTLAITARVTRASIVETYQADFVETLRAKGLTNPQILRHVFKNALSPVLTTSGLQVGYLLGGSVLIETIFQWPGIGLLLYNAIEARDLIVVEGSTLVIAGTFVIINLLVDLLQAVIDPRQRHALA
jgi:peptide/nickel transport system permease protein